MFILLRGRVSEKESAVKLLKLIILKICRTVFNYLYAGKGKIFCLWTASCHKLFSFNDNKMRTWKGKMYWRNYLFSRTVCTSHFRGWQNYVETLVGSGWLTWSLSGWGPFSLRLPQPITVAVWPAYLCSPEGRHTGRTWAQYFNNKSWKFLLPAVQHLYTL